MLPALVALYLSQAVLVKSGGTTDRVTVTTKKALNTAPGGSSKFTYVLNSNTLASSSANTIFLESGPTLGVRLRGWCYTLSSGAPATAIAYSLLRTIQSSTAGTQCLDDTTASAGSCAIARMDPADPQFQGIGRLGGSNGSPRELIDGSGQMVGEIGAGAADFTQAPGICRWYGQGGSKAPYVPAGANYGFKLTISTASPSGISSAAISMYFTAE